MHANMMNLMSYRVENIIHFILFWVFAFLDLKFLKKKRLSISCNPSPAAEGVGHRYGVVSRSQVS